LSDVVGCMEINAEVAVIQWLVCVMAAGVDVVDGEQRHLSTVLGNKQLNYTTINNTVDIYVTTFHHV